MTHTPEPWTAFVEPYEDGEIRVLAKQPYSGNGSFHVAVCNTKADAERIAGCINGCAGLNPAGYQACVEALKHSRRIHTDLMNAYEKDTGEYMDAEDAVSRINQALALAEQPHKEGRMA